MPTLEAVEYNPFKGGGTPEDFSARYGAAAEKAGKALGVDPSVILGQWGLETGWGKSIIPGTNNLGNIKDMSGTGVAATDNMTGSRDKYRSYDTPDAFVDDYVSLLQRKYPGVMNAGADPMKFTGALKGYAEDPQYANKVSQATRMVGNRKGPVAQALDKATDALIPSASAATLEPVDFNPFEVKQAKSEQKTPPVGMQTMANVGAGLIRGAGSIGATILAPYDMVQDAMAGKGLSLESNRQRRKAMDDAFADMGVETDSFGYGAGKLGGEIAGTLGTGSVLGMGARALGAAPSVVNALTTGGMSLGGAPAQTAMQGAGNLLLRAAGGAATGAASAGLVNPTDVGTGAIVGGAMPVALAGLGAAGSGAAKMLRGPDVPEGIRTAAQAGREAGYVVPPTQVRPTVGNRLMEGLAGKTTTAQNASLKNQEVTNKLARQTLGIGDDVPLNADTLDAMRSEAGKAYQAIAGLGKIDAIGAKLPSGVPIQKYTDPYLINRTEVDAGNLIQAWKQANHDATGFYRAYGRDANPETLAKAKAAAADAKSIDRFLADKLEEMGRSDLLAQLKDARVKIAKTYTVEGAMNPATGNIDARKLAKDAAKGKALSGGLEQAAAFAAAFPKAAQQPEVMGSLPQLSPLDWAAGMVGGTSAGIPGMAGLLARPAARATLLSAPVQNRLATAGTPMSDEVANLLLSPVYRAGPLLASDR